MGEFLQTRKTILLKFGLVFVILVLILGALGWFFFTSLLMPKLFTSTQSALLSQTQLEKGTYKLQEIVTPKLLSFSGESAIPAIPVETSYSKDGNLAVFSYKEGRTGVYEIATGRLVFQLPSLPLPTNLGSYADSFRYPTRIKLSPDNKYLARYGGGLANLHSNNIEIYEIATGKLVSSTPAQINDTAVEFNPHNPIAAMRTNKQELILIKLGQPAPFAFIRNSPNPVVDLPGQAVRLNYTRPDLSNNFFYSFKFIGENRLVVLATVCTTLNGTGCDYHYSWGVIKIDADGYELSRSLDNPQFSDYSWFLSENGQAVFLTKHREIVMLNGREGSVTNKISLSFEAIITEEAFSPDGKLVALVRQASSQSGKSIRVFTTEGGRLLADVSLPEDVTHLQFVPNKLQLGGVIGPLTLKRWTFVPIASTSA